MKKCSVGHQFYAHARSKNYGILDDANEFQNVAKNKYSVTVINIDYWSTCTALVHSRGVDLIYF